MKSSKSDSKRKDEKIDFIVEETLLMFWFLPQRLRATFCAKMFNFPSFSSFDFFNSKKFN